MTDPRTDWDRLGRYLAGESSPVERADVERWLVEHPGEARALSALDQATRKLSPTTSVDVEGALRLVKQRRAQAPERSHSWRYVGLAAAAAVVLTIGIRYSQRAAPPATPPAQVYAASTGVGAPDSVSLSGRARAILAPGSRLTFEHDSATLTGRAFFVVSHDATRPFTVRAGDVTVRDVGTRFAVDGDSTGMVRIVVTEGAVDITSTAANGTATRVSAGDVAVASGTGVQLHRGAANADDLAWTQGKLVFRDAPLSAVFADLHRWYGVEIRVQDPAMLTRHFSGDFEKQPVDRVLQTLSLALGTRFVRSADTAFFGSLIPAR